MKAFLSRFWSAYKSVICRYAKSTLVSFFAGMLAYMATAFESITSWEGVSLGLFTSALYAGVRVVPKALLEVFMNFSTKE